MAKPSSLVALAICQKTSDRSWVFSVLKSGECLWKYFCLICLTRLESWLNASEWLHNSALCRGVISHHFELGGPSVVALDVAHQKVRHLPGLERDVTAWVWANAQAQERKEPWSRQLLRGRSSLWKVKWVGHQCLSHHYVVGSYQCTSEFHRADS